MPDMVHATEVVLPLTSFHGPVGVMALFSHSFRATTELSYKDCLVFVAPLHQRYVAVSDTSLLDGSCMYQMSLLINTSYSVVPLLCYFVLRSIFLHKNVNLNCF